MARINSRAKGAKGEREWCAFLKKHFDIDAERQLDQARSDQVNGMAKTGGSDIVIEGFVFEVKRVENLDIQKAWIQCKNASLKYNGTKTPILAFRRNREEWKCAVSSMFIGQKLSYIILPQSVFIEWFRVMRLKELTYENTPSMSLRERMAEQSAMLTYKPASP